MTSSTAGQVAAVSPRERRFRVQDLESDNTNSTADIIHDWTNVDCIVADLAATNANYEERDAASYGVDSVNSAVVHANLNHSGDNYLFLYNSDRDTGYLLADLSSRGLYETAIVLKGAGSGSDFDWSNIIGFV